MIRYNQFMNIVSSNSRDYTQQTNAVTTLVHSISNTSTDRRQQPLGIDSSDFLAELSSASQYSTIPSPTKGEIKINNTRRDANHKEKNKPGKVKKC
jgi:hypothetical protein